VQASSTHPFKANMARRIRVSPEPAGLGLDYDIAPLLETQIQGFYMSGKPNDSPPISAIETTLEDLQRLILRPILKGVAIIGASFFSMEHASIVVLRTSRPGWRSVSIRLYLSDGVLSPTALTVGTPPFVSP
jgi:hypothetical protein